MDKLKIALAQLKKHHFWVLSALIVVTALVAWDAATIPWKQTASSDAKSEVDGRFSAVGNVITTKDPPNEGVIKTIHELIDGTGDKEGEGLKQKVVQAWTFLYEKQTEKNPLPKVLDRGFVKDISRTGAGADQRIARTRPGTISAARSRPTYAETRRNRKTGKEEPPRPKRHAGNTFRGPRPAAAQGRGGRGHRDMNMAPAVERPLATGRAAGGEPPTRRRSKWSGCWIGTRPIWTASRNSSSGRRRPTRMTVRLAQEDLWVYEALLRIIENTNKDEDGKARHLRERGDQAGGSVGNRPAGRRGSWEQDEEPVIGGLAAVSATPGRASPAKQAPRAAPSRCTSVPAARTHAARTRPRTRRAAGIAAGRSLCR